MLIVLNNHLWNIEYLDCLQVFTVINNATMKTLVHISLHTLVIFLTAMDPDVELLWNLE